MLLGAVVKALLHSGVMITMRTMMAMMIMRTMRTIRTMSTMRRTMMVKLGLEFVARGSGQSLAAFWGHDNHEDHDGHDDHEDHENY